MTSTENWTNWGLIFVCLLVVAVLLFTGSALVKIMFFEGRALSDKNKLSATPTLTKNLRTGMRSAFLGPVAAFLGLSIALSWGLTRNPKEIPSALIGKPVPAFTLPPVQGRQLGLASGDLSGEVSLINVFASWCTVCREEHAVLMQLKANGDAPIHGLNYRDRPEDAAHWLDSFGDPYTRTGADQDGRVAIDWGVYGVPETFVVSSDGRIAYKHIGAVTPEVLQTTILPLIESLRRGETKSLGAADGQTAITGRESAR